MPAAQQETTGPTRPFALVVAITKESGIGSAGLLPWHPRRLALDMAFLRLITLHDFGTPAGAIALAPPMDGTAAPLGGGGPARNAVIMGRRTWDSIPARFKPMAGRFNIVLTRDTAAFQRASDEQTASPSDAPFAAASLDEALGLAERLMGTGGGRTFVLGGSAVYKEALSHALCEHAFVTALVEHPPLLPCDAFFPPPSVVKGSHPHAVNITRAVYDAAIRVSPSLATRLIEDASDGQTYAVDADVKYAINVHTRRPL